jgi:hypothetical protein
VLGLNLDREPAIMTENVNAFPQRLQAHISSRPPPYKSILQSSHHSALHHETTMGTMDNMGQRSLGVPDRQHGAHMLAVIWKTEISANWVPGHPH